MCCILNTLYLSSILLSECSNALCRTDIKRLLRFLWKSHLNPTDEESKTVKKELLENPVNVETYGYYYCEVKVIERSKVLYNSLADKYQNETVLWILIPNGIFPVGFQECHTTGTCNSHEKP